MHTNDDILVSALSESDEFCCRSFAEQECLEGVGEAGRTALNLCLRNQRGRGVQDMLGKTPLKYIGFAIAVVGAIVWNRAPNDLVLLVGILVTLGGVSVFGVQFD
jgi:hypothetical protein